MGSGIEVDEYSKAEHQKDTQDYENKPLTEINEIKSNSKKETVDSNNLNQLTGIVFNMVVEQNTK